MTTTEQHKPFFIDVITTPRDNPNIIRETRKINYANPGSRRWLAAHCLWCFTNGFAVHTAASK